MLTTRRGFLGILGAAATTSYFFAPIGGWSSDLIINPNDLVRPQNAVSAGGGTVYYGKYHEQVWENGSIKTVKHTNIMHAADFARLEQAEGPAIRFYRPRKQLGGGIPDGLLNVPVIEGEDGTLRQMTDAEISQRRLDHTTRVESARGRQAARWQKIMKHYATNTLSV